MQNFLGNPCPYCGKNFESGDDIVVCPECGTPHHRDCYKEHSACANEEKHSEAFEIQQTANKIIAALIKVGVFQGEKAVLNMLGFDFGDVRAPFEKISKENYDYIEKTVIPLL